MPKFQVGLYYQPKSKLTVSSTEKKSTFALIIAPKQNEQKVACGES